MHDGSGSEGGCGFLGRHGGDTVQEGVYLGDDGEGDRLGGASADRKSDRRVQAVVKALRPGAKTFVVTDANVARHALPAAEGALGRAGVKHDSIVVPPGEASKSFPTFEQVCEAIVASRIERGDLVVALGGGVIGDLAGFAAAVVRRGLDYVQVPTTLLALVDSSVGGKTAIDSRHGKNLIGAFHQPILVVADTALLDTLPAREFRAGPSRHGPAPT